MDEIARLVAQIEHHDRLYWTQDQPEISDQAYDALVEELRRLAPNHRLLNRLQDVEPQLGLFAADQSASARFGQTVTHDHPMLSLAKAYAFEAVEKWFVGFDGGAVVMPKIDGIACSLRYDKTGELTVAVTRGNGRAGEDITANILASNAVPKHIPKEAAPLEVRGEVYIPTAAFNAHLADRFSNPRNTASGAIKQKDHATTPSYHLSFFAYDLLAEDTPDEDIKFTRLEALGFAKIERRECACFETAKKAVEDYTSGRADLPYETDGVVLRCRLASEQKRLGLTAHHPRFAMAFKFSGDVAETDLLGLTWQVARTGTITPVAQLEPVELSGAMVSKATLHHAGRVESLELALPARVLAARRGGVIPHIEAVIRQGTQPVELPQFCPGCGAPSMRRDDFLICSEPADCRPARIARLIHWARAFELEGLGKKLAEQLHDEGLAQHPVDLYQLQRDDLVTLPRMAGKSADNLLAEIARSRQGSERAFLVALGIDELGSTVAQRLLDELGTLSVLRQTAEERLLQIDGVGDVLAKGIATSLTARSDEIDALIELLDLQEMPTTQTNTGDLLIGRWVVFTGSLASSDRKTAQAQARQLGANTPSGVLSQDHGLLVVGDRDSALLGDGRVSSKHAKARSQIRKGTVILIITETEWLELTQKTITLAELDERWRHQAR